MNRILIAASIILIAVGSISGSSLKMPSFSFAGESVTLICNVDHGDLAIVSITWSKDSQTFYKYDPNNQDPVSLLNVTGVQVKKDLSLNGNSVTLGSVTAESAGVYTCNVQIDHPSLDSGELSGTLKIVPNF